VEALGIRQMARQSGISAHTLRYYERIGLIADVARDAAGRRVYTDRDLSWVEFLTRLRLTGMPIRKMLEYTELMRQGAATEEARAALLEAHRTAVQQRIGELQAMSEVLDRKIAMYRTGDTQC